MDSINSTAAGRKIETTVADTAGQPDVALTKAKQLVESQHVDILTGLVATPECYAVAGYIKQAHVPLIVSADCAAQELTTNAKYASPYLTRFTTVNSAQMDTTADWAYGAGYRKASVMTLDFGAGIEASDLFSSAFIARGGSVVQEQHPPLGTSDFGPYLAQINEQADILVLFIPGDAGLKFGQQYRNYIGQRKLQIMDIGPSIGAGSNLDGIGQNAVGVISEGFWGPPPVYDSPANQTFIKLWKAKFPNKDASEEVADGYVAGQAFVAALQKVNGNLADKQAFLNALYATDIDSPRGHLKLDDHHDIIENNYYWQVVKSGNGVDLKPLKTYEGVGQFWGQTPQQMQALAPGTRKGQWVGMTKEKMGNWVTVH